MLRIPQGFGFEVASMRGSYAKLVRMAASAERQVLTVSIHSQLQAGTVRAIYRQASRFIPGDELRASFFAD